MKTRTLPAALAIALLAMLVPSAASADTFAAVLGPYEQVRQALVADDFAAVRKPAAALSAAVADLQRNLTATTAGVPAAKLADVEALLPAMREASAALAEAADLAAARDAFYDLSKPLVRWRQAAGDGPAVVYCAMKQRSWLQPADAEVGNPYYGQKMARCGEVVSK